MSSCRLCQVFTLLTGELYFKQPHKSPECLKLVRCLKKRYVSGLMTQFFLSSVSSPGSPVLIRWSTVSPSPPSLLPHRRHPLPQKIPRIPPGLTCQTPSDSCHWPSLYPMVAPRPALSLLLAVLACTGPARPSPPLLLRPRERERDSGGVNIAVVHSGSSLLPETAVVGGAGVGEPGSGPGPGPGPGNGPGGGGGGKGVTDSAFLEGAAAMASFSSSSSSSLSLAALVGETVMTPSGQANVIYLTVNESSPGSLLLQLCELLATTPLQVDLQQLTPVPDLTARSAVTDLGNL